MKSSQGLIYWGILILKSSQGREIVPQIVPSPIFTKDFDFEIVPESSQGR